MAAQPPTGQDPHAFKDAPEALFSQPPTLKTSFLVKADLHKGILRTGGTPTKIHANTALIYRQRAPDRIDWSDPQHSQVNPTTKPQESQYLLQIDTFGLVLWYNVMLISFLTLHKHIPLAHKAG